MKKWLLNTVSRYWRMIAAIIGVQAGCAILVSLQPRYYQKIVALAVSDNGVALFSEGLPIIGLLAGLYLGITLLQGIGGYAGSIFSSDLLKQLQIDFFEKISDLPLQFLQRQSAGEFFTKFNNDIGHAQRFIADFFPSVVRELITAIAVTAILLHFCPALLTLTALGIVLATSFLVVKLNRIMAGYAKKQRSGWGEINRLFDETVQGIDTLKIFASEKQRSSRFQNLTSALRNLSVKAGSIAAVFSPSIELVSKLGGLLLIFIAYYLISKGDIPFEPFLLFFFYAALLQTSVSNLINAFADIQTELTGIRNLSAFFSEHPEEDEPDMASANLDKSLSIEIKDLTFSYPGGRALFQNAELFIPSNGITVIHGPSGSGKSTLINLLLRFYDPGQGTIRIGNLDIKKFSRAELRRKISIVTQFHHIFHESLKDNLLIAKPEADASEIEKALKRAHLKEFLNRLPAGLNEVMDPRGKGISGGEKQRICIARLLLRNSPFMILDEPWSNLDDKAKEVLVEVINSNKSFTTILILTHEEIPSLAVDRIYFLAEDKGTFIQVENREKNGA